MNWLAHAFLSTPSTEFQLGNLLADLLRGPDREGLHPEMLRGMACHQSIDAFTDHHPITHRSKARISPEYRRYSGILVDIFYDHFLAIEWQRYADEPLAEFAIKTYREASVHLAELPPKAQMAIRYMIEEDWLGSYARLDGVDAALERVSERLRRRTSFQHRTLDGGIIELKENYETLAGDFAEFFPDLQAHVQSFLSKAPS